MAFDQREFEKEAKEEIMGDVDRELNDMADKIFFKSQQLLDEPRNWISSYSGRSYTSAITDTSFLAGSGEVDKSRYLVKVIRYTAPHAAAIEFGTEPHRVDPAKLERWIIRKLGLKGQEKRVAYAISRKISVAGTDAKPFLRPPINVYIAEGVLEYDITTSPLGVKIRV